MWWTGCISALRNRPAHQGDRRYCREASMFVDVRACSKERPLQGRFENSLLSVRPLCLCSGWLAHPPMMLGKNRKMFSSFCIRSSSCCNTTSLIFRVLPPVACPLGCLSSAMIVVARFGSNDGWLSLERPRIGRVCPRVEDYKTSSR